MNVVSLIGRLGKDPEVRQSQSGTPVAAFNVAVSERKKDAAGKWVDGDPMWITVKAFDNQATSVGEYLRRGDEVGVTGRLRLERWQDRESGRDQQRHVVLASHVEFLRKKDGTRSGPPREEKAAEPPPAVAAPDDMEDLPF